MNKRKTSITDIAKLTGTSITTVSFVLNGKGRISKEISKKIIDVARREGYAPNRMAVGLRTGVSKVIGLIVESIGGPFFGAMARVIEEEAEKAGYGVIYCSTNNSIQKGRAAIKMLQQHLVDGYIITPMKGLEAEIQSLVTGGNPVVLIDGYLPGYDIPHVLVDNYGGTFMAINFLIESGYKNIGFVTVDVDLIQLRDRMQGYKDGLKVNHIAGKSKMICKLPFDLVNEKAILAIKTFIKQNPQMDAVFFSTNYLGVAGLQSINELKINIPYDLAMISFDDHEIFALYHPGITTVKQPTFEIAKSAIDMLLGQMTNEKYDISKVKLKIPAQLIERGSTIVKRGAGLVVNS